VDFVQKNIWLVMIAVASGALFIWPTIAKLFSRGREVGVAEAVLLVCQTGSRSAQACGGLLKDGFGQAVALSGGMAAWQQAGMPVEKDG
jgi:rhodanese-related sulfurtransferase